MSLDSHTVELVDVLPSSYGAVLCIVCVSEFVVRFQGPSEHDLDLWKVDSNSSVIIFVVLGVAISAVYVYLYLVTAKSLMNVLVVKFGCEGYRSVGRTLELRLNEQKSGNRSTGRGLNEINTKMRPFMDKGYFEGIETVETLQPTSAVAPTGTTTGSASFGLVQSVRCLLLLVSSVLLITSLCMPCAIYLCCTSIRSLPLP